MAKKKNIAQNSNQKLKKSYIFMIILYLVPFMIEEGKLMKVNPQCVWG